MSILNRLSRGQALFACAFVLIFSWGSALRLGEAGKLDTAEAFRAAGLDDYHEFGRNLRELGVLGILSRPSAFRAVLYPAFLSAVETYRPDRRPRAPAVQAAVSALAIPAAALAAGQIFGPGAALAAAAMTAFHPALSRSIPGPRIEILYGLLVLLVALMLIRWAREPSRANSAVLGFVIAVSLLCRGVLFAFPLVLAAAALWARPPRLQRGSLWVLVAASYVFLAPWIARNALQSHRFVPFEDRAAARNLLAGALGWVENRDGAFQDLLADEADPRGAFSGDPRGRMFSLALRRIAGAPWAYAASSLRRAFFLCRQHMWLLALLLIAACRFRGDPALHAVGLLCAYFIGAHAPLSVEPRYLEPLLPSLICLAAGAFAWGARSLSFPRLTAAAVLAAAAPLYALSCARLLAEVRYSRFPCLLARGAAASYHCAESAAAAGDWPRAREFYERARARLAGTPGEAALLEAQVHVGLALTELRPGAPGGPHPSARDAVRTYPADARRKALWLQDQGRLAEAIALLTAVLDHRPDDALCLADRAVAYGLAGDDEKSARDLRRSLAVAPANARASLNYGLWLEKKGRPGEALRLYEAALAVEEARMDISPAQTPFQYLAMMRSRVRELRGAGGIRKFRRHRPDGPPCGRRP